MIEHRQVHGRSLRTHGTCVNNAIIGTVNLTFVRVSLGGLAVEEDPFRPEPFSQYPVLPSKILDGLLLSAVDPAGEDQE
jgi:hypothetical protein